MKALIVSAVLLLGTSASASAQYDSCVTSVSFGMAAKEVRLGSGSCVNNDGKYYHVFRVTLGGPARRWEIELLDAQSMIEKISAEATYTGRSDDALVSALGTRINHKSVKRTLEVRQGMSVITSSQTEGPGGVTNVLWTHEAGTYDIVVTSSGKDRQPATFWLRANERAPSEPTGNQAPCDKARALSVKIRFQNSIDNATCLLGGIAGDAFTLTLAEEQTVQIEVVRPNDKADHTVTVYLSEGGKLNILQSEERLSDQQLAVRQIGKGEARFVRKLKPASYLILVTSLTRAGEYEIRVTSVAE